MDILVDNIKLLPYFCSENFTIDYQLMDIISSNNYPDNVKFTAFEALSEITKLENHEIEFALNYIKKLTVIIYYCSFFIFFINQIKTKKYFI